MKKAVQKLYRGILGILRQEGGEEYLINYVCIIMYSTMFKYIPSPYKVSRHSRYELVKVTRILGWTIFLTLMLSLILILWTWSIYYGHTTRYTKYGPITNCGVRARCDAAVRYRTILRVIHALLFRVAETGQTGQTKSNIDSKSIKKRIPSNHFKF